MSMMLVAVTLVMAFGKQSILTRIRSSARYINRIAGGVLVVAGAYIAWFWGTNLGQGADALGDQGAFRFTETLSQRATEIFGENAGLWGLILGGLIAVAAGYTFFRNRYGRAHGPAGKPRMHRPRRRFAAGAAAVALVVTVIGGVAFANSGSSGDTAVTAAAEAPRGPLAPTTSFSLFDGSTATFADYRGRPVVVNFWASWCPSCVAELSNAFKPVQDRLGDQVAFLGVDLQDERSAALDLIEETGVAFDLAEDPDGELYVEFGGIGMPFTVFISADGEVVDKHNGPLSEGQLEDKIQENFLDFEADVPAFADPAPSVDSDVSPEPVPAGSAPEVIVEADPDLPADLARLQGWNTNWGRRTIDSLGELITGIASSDPRDSIPPLDAPEFESVASAAEWLGSREPGVLFQAGDDVRFYPLRILTWHEVANDVVGGRPVVVTFCPLCNTAVVFDPIVNGELLRFGVSGLLRNSDLVMWDSKTDSLWQQITGEGIVGDLAGTQLELLPSSLVSWDDFSTSFPGGKVLSRQTGFNRNYGTNPYVGYSSSERPFLFDGEVDDRFPALDRVVGVTIAGEDKAFPFSVLARSGVANDTVGGIPIAVFWGSDTADALDSADITEGQAVGTGLAFDARVDGQTLTFTASGDDTFTDDQTGTTWDLLGRAIDGPLAGGQLDTVVHRNDFWFAWAAFHPDDPVYSTG